MIYTTLVTFIMILGFHMQGVYYGYYKKWGIWYCFFPHFLFGFYLGVLLHNTYNAFWIILSLNIGWECFERIFSLWFPGLSSKTEIHARGVEPIVDVIWGMLGGVLALLL